MAAGGSAAVQQLRQLSEGLMGGPVSVGWSPTLGPGSAGRDVGGDLDGGPLPGAAVSSAADLEAAAGRSVSQDLFGGRGSVCGSEGEGRYSREDGAQRAGQADPVAMARAVMGVAPFADGDHGGFFDDGDYDESAGEEDDDKEEEGGEDLNRERPPGATEGGASGHSASVTAYPVSAPASDIVSGSDSGVEAPSRAPRAMRAADRLFKLFNSFCATVLRPALHNILDTGDDFVFADDAQASLGSPTAA